jgi:sulfotransferase
MDRQYYFISGLPRSGSTLLSSVLKQNPDFYADISSPLHGIIKSTVDIISDSDNNMNLKEDRRKDLLYSIFNGYYKSIDNKVIFDSSRAWTSDTHILKILFPQTKILVCVRDIGWILDSFELIASKNALYTNIFIDLDVNHSVETRSKALMDVEKNGQIIKPFIWLKEGMSANPEMIHLIEYDDLCKNPEKTMKKVYEFLNLEYFDHDFDNVEYSNENFDRGLGQPNLHTVKKKIEYNPRRSILPDSVWEKCSELEFWRTSKEKDFNYG